MPKVRSFENVQNATDDWMLCRDMLAIAGAASNAFAETAAWHRLVATTTKARS